MFSIALYVNEAVEIYLLSASAFHPRSSSSFDLFVFLNAPLHMAA